MRSAAGSWWREARIAEKETREAENSQGEEERARGEKMENNSTWLLCLRQGKSGGGCMFPVMFICFPVCLFVCRIKSKLPRRI